MMSYRNLWGITWQVLGLRGISIKKSSSMGTSVIFEARVLLGTVEEEVAVLTDNCF